MYKFNNKKTPGQPKTFIFCKSCTDSRPHLSNNLWVVVFKEIKNFAQKGKFGNPSTNRNAFFFSIFWKANLTINKIIQLYRALQSGKRELHTADYTLLSTLSNPKGCFSHWPCHKQGDWRFSPCVRLTQTVVVLLQDCQALTSVVNLYSIQVLNFSTNK